MGKSTLSKAAQKLVKAVESGKLSEADLASARNSLLGRRKTPAKDAANAKNARKTAGVPRPNALGKKKVRREKPSPVQAISHSIPSRAK